jgi:hypothetical protein
VGSYYIFLKIKNENNKGKNGMKCKAISSNATFNSISKNAQLIREAR